MPLETAKLSKRFGNLWVLRDIDLTAQEGRIFGICGGTGSGKSALLTIMAGNEKPNGGAVLLNGTDISAVKAKDRGFQLVTGREPAGILSVFGGSVKGSSGERQLAEFEAAIEAPAKVLLLDDPFNQMDEALRRRCFDIVRKVATDRVVIFAASDFGQIAALADEMVILDETYIKQAGTPLEVYDDPHTVAAARFTGDNNLFEARRLTSTNADLPEFHTIDGGHRIFARAAEKARLGAINHNMTLAIRPEQVSMSMGASFPEDNLLRAVVTGIHFRGPTSLVEFDAGGLKLSARVFKVVGLNIGDECMLGLPPDSILILRS